MASALTLAELAWDKSVSAMKEGVADYASVWGTTLDKTAALSEGSSNGRTYDYQRVTSPTGNISWVLVSRDLKEGETAFGYPQIKLALCAVGDMFTTATLLPMSAADSIDKKLTQIEDFVERYIGKAEADVVEFISESLVDVMYWRKLVCFIQTMADRLKEWNEKYGEQNIQSIHPFIADFCLMAQSCPLLRDYLKNDETMTRWARKTNNLVNEQLDDAASKLSNLSSDSYDVWNDYLTPFGSEDWAKDTIEFLKWSADGGYDMGETYGIDSNPNLSSDERKRLKRLLTERNNRVRLKAREYAKDIATLGDLTNFAKKSEQGFTQKDLKDGVAIGMGYVVYAEVDSEGNVSEVRYVDSRGNECSVEKIDAKLEDDGRPITMLELVKNVCSFTLGALFKALIGLLNSILDFVKALLNDGVQAMVTLTKKVLYIVRTFISTALDALDIPTSEGLVKLMIFYRDYLKCQAAFCQSAHTAKLVAMGQRMTRLFATNLVSKKVQDGFEDDGTPKYRTEYVFELSDVIMERYISPIFDRLDVMVELTGKTMKKVAASCDAKVKPTDGDSPEEIATTYWKTYLKGVHGFALDVLDSTIDVHEIHSAMKSDKAPIFGSLGSAWVEDNKERIEKFVSKLGDTKVLVTEMYDGMLSESEQSVKDIAKDALSMLLVTAPKYLATELAEMSLDKLFYGNESDDDAVLKATKENVSWSNREKLNDVAFRKIESWKSRLLARIQSYSEQALKGKVYSNVKSGFVNASDSDVSSEGTIDLHKFMNNYASFVFGAITDSVSDLGITKTSAEVNAVFRANDEDDKEGRLKEFSPDVQRIFRQGTNDDTLVAYEDYSIQTTSKSRGASLNENSLINALQCGISFRPIPIDTGTPKKEPLAELMRGLNS